MMTSIRWSKQLEGFHPTRCQRKLCIRPPSDYFILHVACQEIMLNLLLKFPYFVGLVHHCYVAAGRNSFAL